MYICAILDRCYLPKSGGSNVLKYDLGIIMSVVRPTKAAVESAEGDDCAGVRCSRLVRREYLVLGGV